MKSTKAFLLFALLVLSVSLDAVFAKPKAKPPKEKKTPPGQAKKTGETLGEGDSVSRTKLTGWFRIHVVGTGKKCIVKEKTKGKTEKEQFGEYASTEAFVEYFGEPECSPGDKGNAKGKVRASVLAEASAIGPDCVAKVISSVMSETKTHKIHDDVTVTVGGEAGGDALALCEVSVT